MSDESANVPLSESVQEAIRRNRKIEAIKLLREEQNIGLKEAKDIIDAQWDAYRGTGTAGIAGGAGRPRMESGMGRVVWIVIVLAALYALFRHFA